MSERYLPQFDVEVDNFDHLPRVCLARTPGENKPVRIVRGMKGYHPVHPATDVERFNSERGITDHQVQAMLMGSMFGCWDTPACHPNTYHEKENQRHAETAED